MWPNATAAILKSCIPKFSHPCPLLCNMIRSPCLVMFMPWSQSRNINQWMIRSRRIASSSTTCTMWLNIMVATLRSCILRFLRPLPLLCNTHPSLRHLSHHIRETGLKTSSWTTLTWEMAWMGMTRRLWLGREKSPKWILTDLFTLQCRRTHSLIAWILGPYLAHFMDSTLFLLAWWSITFQFLYNCYIISCSILVHSNLHSSNFVHSNFY